MKTNMPNNNNKKAVTGTLAVAATHHSPVGTIHWTWLDIGIVALWFRVKESGETFGLNGHGIARSERKIQEIVPYTGTIDRLIEAGLFAAGFEE